MSKLLGDLPRLFPRPEQTIAGVGRLLRERRVTSVDILSACLEQVDAWEPSVQAWVVLDREGALEQARALDEELRGGRDRGPIHGIPIGIKDIIDVKGLPTACGARRWSDRVAEVDAHVVAALRGEGAIIMGKTVTTPYAWIDPPPTRNPWDPERTPGGSSSGSAAAVACGMCYGAIGTQTGGSITRPASFCGVAGMKPKWAAFSKRGVLPLAPELDHIGPIARGVADLRLLFVACRSASQELSQWAGGADAEDRPFRLGRLRGYFDRRAEPITRSLMDAAARDLADRGAEVVDIEDPVDFEEILAGHRTIMAAEAAATHSDWLDAFPDDYPPRIRELVDEGRATPALAYIRAREAREDAWQALRPLWIRSAIDALITPASIGPAPGRATTGDPAFNSPWSYLRSLPTVSFPIGQSPEGLPVAMQLIGLPYPGPSGLRVAEWCEAAIRTSRQ